MSYLPIRFNNRVCFIREHLRLENVVVDVVYCLVFTEYAQ